MKVTITLEDPYFNTLQAATDEELLQVYVRAVKDGLHDPLRQLGDEIKTWHVELAGPAVGMGTFDSDEPKLVSRHRPSLRLVGS